MVKRAGAILLRIFLGLLLLVGIAHAALNFATVGTGIQGFGEKGISGSAISDLGERFSIESPLSKIILIAEWGALIILIVFVLVRNKVNIKKEAVNLNIKSRYGKS